MWKLLREQMDLDPPKKMWDSQYLGCSQKDFVPDERNVQRVGAAFEKMSIKGNEPSARVAHPELCKEFIEPYGADMQGKGKVKRKHRTKLLASMQVGELDEAGGRCSKEGRMQTQGLRL